MKYKNIPIAAAKRIAKDYDKDQVIIVTWDNTHSMMHVTTYGKSINDCEQAAQGGNFVRKALGFPEEDCNVKPARIKRKEHVN
jgi:hypothetical protein